MAQFAVLIFDKEIPFEEIPPEILEQHGEVEGKVEGTGGKIVAGYAAAPTSEARTVRGDAVAEGPFHDVKQQLTGFFVIEARDLDHAVEIAKFVPIVDGGVEVRPLLGEE
ncbi:YciI family protein [Amycolatopsis sp. NPDC026612]|uniref:YciI family protein n=1 Tax=Amycolatopsis sp. NPDC026612 TaxID=3155466 RepID=UPI0033C90A01